MLPHHSKPIPITSAHSPLPPALHLTSRCGLPDMCEEMDGVHQKVMEISQLPAKECGDIPRLGQQPPGVMGEFQAVRK